MLTRLGVEKAGFLGTFNGEESGKEGGDDACIRPAQLGDAKFVLRPRGSREGGSRTSAPCADLDVRRK